MKLLATSLALLFCLPASAQQKWNYPPAQKNPVYDTVFGRIIKDDFRWMEKADDPLFVNWLHEQNKFADSVVAIIPGQDRLAVEIRKAESALGTDYIEILQSGHNWLYRKMDMTNFSEAVYIREGINGKERLWFSKDSIAGGNENTLHTMAVYPSGKYATDLYRSAKKPE